MARSLVSRLPFSPHIRPLHATTYLLGVALFSISFLVFLNSSVSFVLTDLLHLSPPIGDIVGTLGFADELVAIFAAPLWGVLSDGPLGTRGVVVSGYAIIFLSLIVFVNVPSVYPGLLLARMLFSVGGAAVATMVSAILPEMTASPPPSLVIPSTSGAVTIRRPPTPPPDDEPHVSHSEFPLLAGPRRHPTGKLAGLVGLFTGLGALIALGVFLPLPTHFAAQPGVSREDAVRRAFYSVSLIALAVGIWCLLGLPPPAETPGSKLRPSVMFLVKKWLWTKVWGGDPAVFLPPSPELVQDDQVSSLTSLTLAIRAGTHDSRIALSYLGGFVARSTSVGISLFIPLFVNHYFVASGLCKRGADPQHECRRAYVLAAELTGVSQLMALCCAPVFGYMTDHPPFGLHRNTPLVASALIGVLGFSLFAVLPSPEPSHHPEVFAYVVMMGVGQIGGIVCSLGIMGRGVVEEEEEEHDNDDSDIDEESPLMAAGLRKTPVGRRRVKGGIAGVYSLCGGAGILALTKLGGLGFDRISRGWPFWMLAGFEAMLAVGGLVEGFWGRK